MSLPEKGAGSKKLRDGSDTEVSKNKTMSPAGNTFDSAFSGDLAMAMLLEVLRGLTELRVDVKHLTATTESIRGNVEILEKDVEILINWKKRVFGGVTVLAVLWGIFGALSGARQ
jgi:hypothetical protein